MKLKIPFVNKIIAFVLSIILTGTMLISFFSLPVELILFNPDSYYPVIEEDRFSENYSQIISELIVAQIFNYENPDAIPLLLSDQTTLTYLFNMKIPSDMALLTMKEAFNQTLEYLNFKRPSFSINIKIDEIKSVLVQNSAEIAEKYIETLPSCGRSNPDEALADGNLTIFELPPCKPNEKNSLMAAEQILETYLQDSFNKLPVVISLSKIVSFNENQADSFFRQYSIFRWLLRLLPMISILILILISLLLNRQRTVMVRWIGRLLLCISGISLLCMVLLMIGFDQFTALLLNPLLKTLVVGFDMLVLGIAQSVGYQSLIWVIVTIIVVAGFGVFLILAEKLLKSNDKELDSQDEETDLPPAGELEDMDSEEPINKEVMPETLEELEQKENEEQGIKRRRKPKQDQSIN